MTKHELPQLSYDYSALEPTIDKRTMTIHHSKHHQAYVDKLNAALESAPELADTPLTDILADLSQVPESIRTAVQNNGGGHYNHSFFWTILSPTKQECSGLIKEKIDETFGSFDEFKAQFTQAAMTRFGSGWAWLVLQKDHSLKIVSTPNQDSPIMTGETPLIGLDVWEHAYYLNYQNKRPEYIENFFDIISWSKVNELLESAQ